MMNFTTDMTGEIRHVVEDKDTANAQGNPGVHVLSTPNLTLFCEMACHEAIYPEFDDRTASVGTHNDLYHMAATPVGEQIVITATVTEIDRKRLTFEIAGHDERNQIVRGTCERFLVDLETFLASLPPPKG